MSRLYAFGSNGSGQLGIGTTEDAASPQKCLLQKDMDDIDVPHTDVLPGQLSKIAAGGNHTLIALSTGQVYSSGCVYGNMNDNYDPVHVFHKRFSDKSEMKLCSALWEASVFVTDDESIYSQGRGSRGELGAKTDNRCIWQRVLINPPLGTQIVDITSGMAHTVVILSNGEAYGWGNGRKGQLGEPAHIVETPRKIERLGFRVMRAVCGREFTYFVGEDCHAVLGSDKWNVRSDTPSSVSDWTDIAASWGSIFVLKTDGEIISWGRNDHGQLAPPNLPEIKQIAVGSEHVVALTKAGAVLCWGWGEHGNCGRDTDDAGDVKNRWNEVRIDNGGGAEVVGVGAGWATSFIWVKTT